MREYSYDTEHGTIYYKKREEGIVITSYRGNDSELILKSEVENLPVISIDKKAFLGSRKLRNILLPASITSLGEWAFASCKWLENVVVCRSKMTIGKGAFLNTDRLNRIVLLTPEELAASSDFSFLEELSQTKENEAVLLAAVNVMKDSEYLMDFSRAGKKSWIKQWDNRLLKILNEPDEAGYTEMILCGEEDINCNIETYIENKRKVKSRFCFLRLLYAQGLSESMKTTLENYLISHDKKENAGDTQSEEAWLVLKEEKGHLRSYYELYTQLGCLTEENYDATIKDLGSSNPEMKAYFIRYHEEHMQSKDFFEQFSL